ncbi:AAA family ATPase [Arcobacter sp. YIC-464]|uniref:AAA family ATPase n=1 Tax=Arcobacter sp. YIC-464 TaxID=3376631 RepID=UPI003C165518
MELVYLWVEEYKNIKKQGFNFSPRFRCEFKDEYKKDKDGNEVLKDDCELIIEENEDYVSIFPENINITAIVGENGSGKTTIIESIVESIKEETHIDFKYLLVYKIGELKYISNIDLECSIKKENLYNNICTGVYKKDIDNGEIYQTHYYCSANLNFIESNKYEVSNILSVETGEGNTSFNLTTFMYFPIKIEIELKDSQDLIIQNINFISKDKDLVRKKFESLKKSDYYYHYLFINYLRKSGIDCKLEILDNRDKLKDELPDVLDETDFNKYFLKLKSKKVFYIASLKEEEKDIYLRKNGFWDFFYFDFIDEKNRRYNDLSHGEQMIFGQLLNIYFYSKSNDDLLFLFDEPETSLHSDWQKKYIEEVIILLERLDRKYHFLFSSHSAFLLSDLPKENVIFLEKDEQTGNCINATDKMKDFKTFGANIHTLLSHGFFMKDGLMGEFAKSKIERIKRFYDFTTKYKDRIFSKEKVYLRIEKYYKSNKKEFEHISSIIGEPFLQKVIKNYLDELEEIFDKENYKQKRLKKLVEEFGEDTLREYLK